MADIEGSFQQGNQLITDNYEDPSLAGCHRVIERLSFLCHWEWQLKFPTTMVDQINIEPQ
jgi:hypothetical protein